MIIQTISIRGIFGRWWGYHSFQKITDNDNNVIEYRYNGQDGYTKEELDKKYRELKSICTNEMELEHETTHITIDKYIENLDNSIDRYVEYIDNGRQYSEAVECNKRIEAKIKQYEELKAKGVE